MRRLHFAGLAHSDLSHSNVLIDPKHGDACVIDIDFLGCAGIGSAERVLGMPGYIAPEVITGKALPAIETDLHALAVLIYETLLLRHPLQGPKFTARIRKKMNCSGWGKSPLHRASDRQVQLPQERPVGVGRAVGAAPALHVREDLRAWTSQSPSAGHRERMGEGTHQDSGT